MPLVPGFFFGRNGKSREYYGRVIVCSEQGFLSLAELFFFFFKIFSWKIIALQYCAASATSTWISHSNTHIPSLSTSLPFPRPLACHRALGWAPCVTQQMPTGYLFHICCSASCSECKNFRFWVLSCMSNILNFFLIEE